MSIRNVGDDVSKLQDAQVFVVGDLILDTYISGSVQRISPEAPVLVVQQKKVWSVLGGAANVAANIADFGGSVWICGRVGKDEAGITLQSMCNEKQVRSESIVIDHRIPTIQKTRILSGYQQLIRIDQEEIEPIDTPTQELMAKSFEVFCKKSGPKSLVISDYGKGICEQGLLTKLIHLAQISNIPIIVDPKSKSLAKYRGATVIKPNLSEGRSILMDSSSLPSLNQDEEFQNIARAVGEASESNNVVLSLSEKGVLGFDRVKQESFLLETTALQVADVSGAGDTMVAFLAMGFASGLPFQRTVQLANIAAGIVCTKLGTATLDASEFMESFKDETEQTSPEKVLSVEDMERLAKSIRDENRSIVFTNGCFDLIHVGHIETIQFAKSLGDYLIVAINSDSSVKRLKGASRPLQSHVDRARIIASIAAVDFVVIFDEDTPLSLINRIRPHYLVKGGDYKENEIVGASEVKSWGGSVVTVPLVPGKSTSGLVAKSTQK
jgi:D-beta-D-heptose 7-phosphate kinase/D-beta-D-heptose 1-phosphate adenosyltransferase